MDAVKVPQCSWKMNKKRNGMESYYTRSQCTNIAQPRNGQRWLLQPNWHWQRLAEPHKHFKMSSALMLHRKKEIQIINQLTRDLVNKKQTQISA